MLFFLAFGSYILLQPLLSSVALHPFEVKISKHIVDDNSLIKLDLYNQHIQILTSVF